MTTLTGSLVLHNGGGGASEALAAPKLKRKKNHEEEKLQGRRWDPRQRLLPLQLGSPVTLDLMGNPDWDSGGLADATTDPVKVIGDQGCTGKTTLPAPLLP
ncbi:hypothetical protein CRG98_016121 [Punica granatum]|uniref:Uncharacterized protein n=1 Tax=Punica granatum TaxID=22663 RepID=A0A2I0K4I3_PUNGR|nr:hypothetical protein CRG98_016121 [Punica granatum]